MSGIAFTPLASPLGGHWSDWTVGSSGQWVEDETAAAAAIKMLGEAFVALGASSHALNPDERQEGQNRVIRGVSTTLNRGDV